MAVCVVCCLLWLSCAVDAVVAVVLSVLVLCFGLVILRAGSFGLWFVVVLLVPTLVLLIARFSGAC